MLQKHLSNCEKCLMALYEIGNVSGHPVNKGDSREMFVDNFLRDNLPTSVNVGRGEIVGCKSKPGQNRNQFDVIVYRSDFPQINMGGGNCACLVESLCATIEVKSCMSKRDVEQAVEAAHNIKSLSIKPNQKRERNDRFLYCGLVAYKTSAKKIKTVVKWLCDAEAKIGIKNHNDKGLCNGYQSPSIDCVVVLGRGIIHCYNPLVGLAPRNVTGPYRWVYVETTRHNLLLFYLQLLFACRFGQPVPFNYLSYVRNTRVYKGINVVY